MSRDPWQKIETAPKSTEVLVYVPRRSGNFLICGAALVGTQWWGSNVGAVKPTHWMKLPDPPEPA
jgi:hypothetical protein